MSFFELHLESALLGVGLIVFFQYVIQPIQEKLYYKSKIDNPILNYFVLGRKIK